MDYEKKYKNLLAKAKEMESQGYIDEECLYDMFPELREESEDERLRKALIKYYSFDKDGGSHALDNITPKQIVTWLKKQGKQKSTEWSLPYGKNETAEKLIALAECLEADGDCLFNGLSGDDYGKFLRVLAIELTQPKQKWSEEDEYYYGIIQYILNNECVGKTDKENAISWLKSLKNRIHSQPEQEWSEEDETVLNNLIYALANDRIGNYRDEYVGWLKSLRPQNRWKPSDGQMSALKEQCVRKKSTVAGAVLCELFHDLEKLRGE